MIDPEKLKEREQQLRLDADAHTSSLGTSVDENAALKNWLCHRLAKIELQVEELQRRTGNGD